jgi:pimeloyl-ACP methyl ester carboxylesterase
LNTFAAEPVTLFCLHYLGGSGLEYAAVAGHAERGTRIVPIDLAGFGNAAHATGFSVSDMVRDVAGVIRNAAAPRWWLVGHSMGAKVATVLASCIETQALPLEGLAGLMLLAGSPPSPEPMDDEKRETMLGWFRGDQNTTLAEARRYLDQNVSNPLAPSLHAQALADLQRMNRSAWSAWLNSGSREDWAERVGVLRTPALLVAGSDDASLGAAAQRRYMAPHFAHVEFHVIDRVAHLLPLEAAATVARLLGEHVTSPSRTAVGFLTRG